jgi:signal peptide peptidase SppA
MMPIKNEGPYFSRFADQAALVAVESSAKVSELLSALYRDSRLADLRARQMNGYRVQASDDPCDDDENFWPEADSWLSRLRPYNVKDGVLIIPVKGVLLADFSYAFFDYATGYDYIWQAFKRGMNDGGVNGIALDIDSPGGEVQGNFDLVDRMYAMIQKSDKPVRSFANEHAYSAAYSIASVGDQIIVGRTGGVGSIGVVTSHVDYSKMLEDYGVKLTFIFAGAHKVDGNPYQALPDSVKARIQTRIDAIYAVFVATVARNRKMDEKAIRATEALTYSAEDAVAIGLADKVGPADEALSEFTASCKPKEEEFPIMTTKDQGGTETKVTVISQADVDSAEAKGKADGDKAGRTAAKERIKAIYALEEAKKRPQAAQACAMDTEMSVDEAKAFLAKLPEEASGGAGMGNKLFQQLMEKDNPNLGGGNDDGPPDRVAQVLADQALIHGFKPKNKAA